MTKGIRRASGRACIAIALASALTTPVFGQGRTDVVTLANGDRITGEIIRLQRGQLEFKTDDAGTLHLEWDKLASLVATARLVEVVLTDGRRFLGTLGPAADKHTITVVAVDESTTLRMTDVTFITAIGASFWSKLDGSVDAGFSYTQSSGIAQVNFNSDTIFRRPASQGRFTMSLTLTKEEDSDDADDRGSAELSYVWYPWNRWFVAAAGRFETNESLGLLLRSQVGASVGPRLVTTNRALVLVGGGLVVNNEQGVDVEPTQNVEGFFVFQSSYYTYDSPKTNIDFKVQYYPSLSTLGRHRVQLDTGLRRELFKDFFVALNVYDSYDSRPPNAEAKTNDVGIVLSVGWSY